jgi:hypothetical protein
MLARIEEGHIVADEVVQKVREHIRTFMPPHTRVQSSAENSKAGSAMEGSIGTLRSVTTGRRIAALLAKPLLLLALLMPLHASPQVATLPISDAVSYRGLVMRDWVSAVLRHTPGVDDEALAVVRRWNAEDLRDGWVGVHVMVALLQDPRRRGFVVPQRGASIPVSVVSQDLWAMALKAEELRHWPGRNDFLKRAAVLHTDAALLTGSKPPRPPFNSSFLLPGRVFVQTGDGTQAGLYGGDVNWEFGRILLDGVADAGRDREVRDWYGATLAHLLAVDHLDNPHFEHALRLFPRTADILFLKGCLHESLANPRVQAVIDEVKVPRRTVLDVKSERWELSEAARLFRRALQADPEHGEARLRLGRTLARLGRHQDAASELTIALDHAPEPLLQYYALLFIAAEEEALGRFDRARAMYERAMAIVPGAQAPHLGLSQLAHRTGDRVAARTALEPLLAARHGETKSDPWWVYSISCGRDANARMRDVHRAVSERLP